MGLITGRQVDLGIGRESTRGTGVDSEFWIPKTDFSFDDVVEDFRVQSGMGSLDNSEQVHILEKYGQGDISAEVRSKSIGLFLYALMGSVSSSSVVDEAYTHTFTQLNSTQHPSLTINVLDANSKDRYRLSMLNTFELSCDTDSILNFSTNFIGKTSIGSGDTASYSAETKFAKQHTYFKLADDIAGLATASNISIKSFKLSGNKAVTVNKALGSSEPEDINNTIFEVTGEFVLNYTGETYKNYMRDGTYKAMEVGWINTDVTIGSGSTNPSLKIQLPKADFKWSPNYALDEIITQTVTFTGNKDLSTGQNTVHLMELVNGQASY